MIAERAAGNGDAPALLSERECLTYAGLVERANRYSRWAIAHGLAKGECVGLLMPNRPEFMAIWLGITQVGGVVALLNTNLTGASLAHAVQIVAPKHLIVASELVHALESALPQFSAVVWVHGAGQGSWPRLDQDIEKYGGEPLSETENRPVTIEDRALYIYTSGTTGMPKAASISHARVMQWTHWFAGLLDTQPGDRMYDCLPMYHSVGGVQAPGAVLVGGGVCRPSREILGQPLLDRHRPLGLHAVPIHRRALPLSSAHRSLP